MHQRRSVLAAFFALAAVLFAQLAIAAAAWDDPPAPCHQPANVCFEHCSNNDLTLDVPRIKVPQPAAAPALVVQLEPVHYASVAPVRTGVLPAGPPRRILFQSFRS
jgi:hypothetical protein